jgi:hypothetical protein
VRILESRKTAMWRAQEEGNSAENLV